MVSSIGYSLGIGSGIDIKSLIDGLSQAERAPKDALLKKHFGVVVEALVESGRRGPLRPDMDDEPGHR